MKKNKKSSGRTATDTALDYSSSSSSSTEDEEHKKTPLSRFSSSLSRLFPDSATFVWTNCNDDYDDDDNGDYIELNETSYGFQLYNFVVGILFLAFGLNLISGSMMLVNVGIAFVHLDLGLSSHTVTELRHRVESILGLLGLVFLYMGLVWQDKNESLVAEGFGIPELLLLAVVVGAESKLWSICQQETKRQKKEMKKKKKKKQGKKAVPNK